MSSASALAAGFTISGILDEGARTRKRFPVSELPVADIQDHPNNVVYSMDEASIEKLAGIGFHGFRPLKERVHDLGRHLVIYGRVRAVAIVAALDEVDHGVAGLFARGPLAERVHLVLERAEERFRAGGRAPGTMS